MKKLIFLFSLLACASVSAFAQSGNVPITITEVDGSPRLTNPSKIVVSNGTLTISGRTATISTGGGGGGGCTPPGTANRVLYDDGAGGCTSAAGFLFNGTATATLGVAGTSVGTLAFKNATSGTINLIPVTGALGTVSLSLPAATDTLVGRATTDTLTNKTLTTPTIGDFSNATHNHQNNAGGGTLTTSALSGLGTGVATALGINVGSAGAFVVNGGALGTPSSGTLTNATGLPISTGVSGLGTGVATWLATPSSANLAAAVTDETGSGALVFGTSPDFTTGITIGGVAVPTISSTSTFTNKTLTSSTNVLGTVTMTLGSDADGDTYYRSSNVLTRLAKGTAGQCLQMNGGATAPTWGSCGGASGITVGTTTITSGTNGRLAFNNSGVYGETSGATSNGTSVTFTSGNLIATSPQITTGINDSNGNSLIAVTPTASAVYGLTLANAALAGTVAIGATAATQSTSAVAGPNLSITAGAPAAGSSVAGAIAGSSVTISSTAAVRLTSGNANGGNISLVPGAGIGTGTTGQILIGNPSLSTVDLASNASGGSQPIMTFSTGTIAFKMAGSATNITFNNSGTSGLALASAMAITWNSQDLTIRRSAAANLAMGAGDAASPVAQTLSVQNVVAGTSNTAGASWTFKGSAGTGTGAGGSLIFQVAPAGSTGTSQNTFSTALTIPSTLGLQIAGVTFANLPSSTDGTLIYCSDCAPTSAFVNQTCTSGGTGSMAFRLNGAWKCYN